MLNNIELMVESNNSCPTTGVWASSIPDILREQLYYYYCRIYLAIVVFTPLTQCFLAWHVLISLISHHSKKVWFIK